MVLDRQRTTLLLFRQNLNKIISKIESGQLPNREVKEIHYYLTPLREALNEILMLFPKKKKEYLKRADPANTEVLFNSVLLSFEKISETIDVFEEHCKWRKDIGINIIRTCIDLNEKLFNRIHVTNLTKKSIDDLINYKDKTIIELYKKLK